MNRCSATLIGCHIQKNALWVSYKYLRIIFPRNEPGIPKHRSLNDCILACNPHQKLTSEERNRWNGSQWGGCDRKAEGGTKRERQNAFKSQDDRYPKHMAEFDWSSNRTNNRKNHWRENRKIGTEMGEKKISYLVFFMHTIVILCE